MTINYVPKRNRASDANRRRLEAECILGDEPRTLGELITRRDALARQAAEESRHSMVLVVYVLAAGLVAVVLALIATAPLWWPG